MAEASIPKEIFKQFAKKEDGKAATSKDLTKWFTDAKVLNKKTCTSNNFDIAFSKVKTKGQSVLRSEQMVPLIQEVAKSYAKDNKMSEPEAVTKITGLLLTAGQKGPDFASGATQACKVGGVDRLTDASKYTGSHKERFDESGKGKGIAGRENITDGSGYVGAYKGADSYDKTH